MKTRTNAVLVVLALLAYFSGLRAANAFYDPGAQRWLNRDPLGDQLFLNRLLDSQPRTQNKLLADDSIGNPYLFVQDSPISLYDAVGLKPIKLPDLWDKLPDQVKDKIKTYLLNKTLEDAKKACDQYDKCKNKADANAVVECQMCAIYKCAKNLPMTALAMENCLKGKFALCGEGVDP